MIIIYIYKAEERPNHNLRKTNPTTDKEMHKRNREK